MQPDTELDTEFRDDKDKNTAYKLEHKDLLFASSTV